MLPLAKESTLVAETQFPMQAEYSLRTCNITMHKQGKSYRNAMSQHLIEYKYLPISHGIN
ncbi:Uncharacterised protein [Yersinia enterocolitica]|nr:Uncharacterised protein [Yersinia enterocolitica]